MPLKSFRYIYLLITKQRGMKFFSITSVVLFVYMMLGVTSSSAQYHEEKYKAYINDYAILAMQEMQRTGIPASIILAQALLDSDAGKNDLAIVAKNHFKIRCEYDYTGVSYYKMDDDYNEKWEPILSCFIVFPSAEACYLAYADRIANPEYAGICGFLFTIPTEDYKSWAIGLANTGHSVDINYADRLIEMIEKYKLYDYDLNVISSSS